jgi:hypothetical protein
MSGGDLSFGGQQLVMNYHPNWALLRKSIRKAVVPRECAESRDKRVAYAHFLDPADEPRDDNLVNNEQNLIYATTLWTVAILKMAVIPACF